MCEHARGWPWVSSLTATLPCVFETIFHWTPNSPDSTLISTSSGLGLWSLTSTLSFLNRNWGSELRFLCLESKYFPDWAFFLTSTHTFLTSWKLDLDTNELLRAYKGQLPVVNWWCQFSKCWRPPSKFPWDITAYNFSTIPIISVVLKLSRFELKQTKFTIVDRMLGGGRE